MNSNGEFRPHAGKCRAPRNVKTFPRNRWSEAAQRAVSRCERTDFVFARGKREEGRMSHAVVDRGLGSPASAVESAKKHLAIERNLDSVSDSLFDTIVVNEVGPATALANRMLGDYAAAADAVYVALDRAREEFGIYDGSESPRSWVLRFVAEEAVRRSTMQEPRRPCEDISQTDARAVLQCLGPEPRLAVILTDILGMTDETAAEISGVDERSLRDRVRTAREWLSRHLAIGHSGPAIGGAFG